MDESNGVPISRGRRSSSRTNDASNGHYGPMYRRDSNLSTSSFLDDIEMAQDEVFAGPMGESIPTSISSFAHRRGRADSTTSFTYYQEDDEENLPPSEVDSAILEEESELNFEEEHSADLEAGELSAMRRTSSGQSRASVHDRLLRSDSMRTDGSNLGRGHRTNQKIYIVTEDLTIVVAGFRTSTLGFALYTTICVLTLGLGYLLFRWLPRWQVRIIGTPCPLRSCGWVVVEVSTQSLSGVLQFYAFNIVNSCSFGVPSELC
jgi:cation-transporting P-type ATPase 13A2